jgi:hypothetical protein
MMQRISYNLHQLSVGRILIQSSIFKAPSALIDLQRKYTFLTCRIDKVDHDKDTIELMLLHFYPEEACLRTAYYPPIRRKISELIDSHCYWLPNSEVLKALRMRSEIVELATTIADFPV